MQKMKVKSQIVDVTLEAMFVCKITERCDFIQNFSWISRPYLLTARHLTVLHRGPVFLPFYFLGASIARQNGRIMWMVIQDAFAERR